MENKFRRNIMVTLTRRAKVGDSLLWQNLYMCILCSKSADYLNIAPDVDSTHRHTPFKIKGD